MATVDSVKVLQICRVAPPPGSVTKSSLPLTFLDLLWMPLPPLQRLFFYEFPHSKTYFMNYFIPQIKHSLSLTLQHFYPLAGHLVWPLQSDKPTIEYNEGDSVSFILAESETDFYHITSNHPKDATESHPFVPELQVTGELVPVFALQVTYFPNMGICIGTSTHHTVMDGKIYHLFMKAWASICRVGDASSLTQEMIPFIDKTIIKDPRGIEKIFIDDLQRFFESESDSASKYRELKVLDVKLPPNMVRATFEFSEIDIAKLKKWVLAYCEEETNPFHVSTFMVTAAYVWVCLVKAQSEVISKNEATFGITVDYRSRLDPPIPSSYFGNCIGYFVTSSEKSNLMGENGFVEATKLIKKMVKGIEEEPPLNGAEDWLSVTLSLKGERITSAAGSTRFRVYETDFGWGKPKKVELISNDRTGAICFSESKKDDGRGVEVGFVLGKKEMDSFASLFINGLNYL